jgi:hypothetical protein
MILSGRKYDKKQGNPNKLWGRPDGELGQPARVERAGRRGRGDQWARLGAAGGRGLTGQGGKPVFLPMVKYFSLFTVFYGHYHKPPINAPDNEIDPLEKVLFIAAFVPYPGDLPHSSTANRQEIPGPFMGNNRQWDDEALLPVWDHACEQQGRLSSQRLLLPGHP